MKRLLCLAIVVAAGCGHAGTANQATPSSPAAIAVTRPTNPPTMEPMDMAPPVTLNPKPNAAEAKFVAAATHYLAPRYSTPEAAEAAGYVRYTAEDQDGIITYTNLKWFADDPRHPTQLWYDVHGRFLGADYPLRVSDRSRRPRVWGLQPGRWSHFISHIHYVVVKDGKTEYRSMLNDDYQANGGDPANPSAQPIVRAGYAKQPSDVKLIFQLPEMWIASTWLVPNPNGAFAESDSLVHATAGAMPDMHPR